MPRDRAVGDRRLDDADDEARRRRREAASEPDRDGRDEALQPEQRPRVRAERRARRRRHRRDRGDRARQREGEADEQLDRDADDARALRVVDDRPQPAARVRPRERPARGRSERKRDASTKSERTWIDAPADRDEALVADAPERQRIREDVRGPAESRLDAAWIAKPTASVPATQPIVDPRAR